VETWSTIDAVIELLLVLALIACLVAATIAAWTSLLMAGAVLTGAGLLFGVGTGLCYHVVLARALLAAKAHTPRWWLRPVSLHERLDEASRRRVMPWFYAGAAGFIITVAGLALVALGIAANFFRLS
jgi:hypothetical protein